MKRRLIGSLLAVSILAADVAPLMAVAEPQQQSATRRRKKNTSKTRAKTQGKTSGKASGKAPAKKSGTKATPKQETSADVKRQQEAAQKEIRETKAQIQRNDAAIRTGLADLSRIRGEVEATQKSVNGLEKQVTQLTGRISTLEAQIAKGESELTRLRDEYYKAIKKMRVTRKNQSALAFLFASENFNQAVRRMRYLKQFSDWKDKQSAEINTKIADLRVQGEQLAKARDEQSVALRKERQARVVLEKKRAEQDALVAELKRNGQALNEHLARKQAEANALGNRVASLIAAEEQARRDAEARAKREADEKARKAAEEKTRKAAEEKARREQEAREARERNEAIRKAEEARKAEEVARKAEAERVEAERQAKADAAKQAEAKRKAKEAEEARKAADKARKEAERASREKTEADRKAKEEAERKAKEEAKKKEKERKHTHTEGRRRKKQPSATEAPGASGNVAKPSTPAPAAQSSGNFEAMRGSLPRPVSGAFKVTNPFGRHELAGLPGVQYDNPGIDAQVASGASANAVFGGKVSGVYAIPGFGTVVIVSHGNYYTVYGNLASVSVKAGDQVKQGQKVGTVAKDPDNASQGLIHFEVWKNREKQNPMSWIR